MAENLRYGKEINSSIPQTDNGITEYYLYEDQPSNLEIYGGLYSQYETLNYKMSTHNQGICPPGWRVPDLDDWKLIDIKVSQYFIKDYYGPQGISGFNLQFGGNYLEEPDKPPIFTGRRFQNIGFAGEYWTTDYAEDPVDGMRYQGAIIIEGLVQNATINWTGFTFTKVTDQYLNGTSGIVMKRNWFFSVRCIKNEQ